MRKEVFLAIVAGVLIGLGFAFGSWKLFRTVKKPSPVSFTKPTPKQNNELFLNITNLSDYQVVTKNLTITGETNPNSQIVIISKNRDYYLKVDGNGLFEESVNLEPYLNEIKIIRLDEDGDNLIEKKLKVITDEEIHEKKLEAYVGAITDISGETIQIKDLVGGIKQIIVDTSTVYINNLKKGASIKLSDLAIGDYVISIGSEKNNKVLEGKKILIDSPLEENKYVSRIITIESLSKQKINDIVLPKKWNGPDTKDLEIGQNIILVGLQNEDKFDLRSIFLIN